MKKIILKVISLAIIFNLAACANGKRNEEIQYYSFNEKNKASVKKADIYITRVTKAETLATNIADITSKHGSNVKQIGSWDFTQKPSSTTKDEITNKAVELGANYVIIFEKKDCDTIDIKKNEVEPLVGSNCYHILYYNLPAMIKNDDVNESKVEVKPAQKAEASAPVAAPAAKLAVEPVSAAPVAK